MSSSRRLRKTRVVHASVSMPPPEPWDGDDAQSVGTSRGWEKSSHVAWEVSSNPEDNQSFVHVNIKSSDDEDWDLPPFDEEDQGSLVAVISMQKRPRPTRVREQAPGTPSERFAPEPHQL